MQLLWYTVRATRTCLPSIFLSRGQQAWMSFLLWPLRLWIETTGVQSLRNPKQTFFSPRGISEQGKDRSKCLLFTCPLPQHRDCTKPFMPAGLSSRSSCRDAACSSMLSFSQTREASVSASTLPSLWKVPKPLHIGMYVCAYKDTCMWWLCVHMCVHACMCACMGR